jgi:hypothetical protein
MSSSASFVSIADIPEMKLKKVDSEQENLGGDGDFSHIASQANNVSEIANEGVVKLHSPPLRAF